MTRVEMVARALQELTGGSAVKLAAFIEKTYGEKIEPKYIPIFRASIQEKVRLDQFRQAAKEAREQAMASTVKETTP